MSQKEGVIKGRLTSLSRNITVRHDFIKQAANLTKIYLKKNFKRVKSIVRAWMAKQNGLLAHDL